jgi:hypothetical protein
VDSVGLAPNAVITTKIKDSTIVKADLDTTLLTWIKTQAGGGGGGGGYPPDFVTITLTIPDSELTIANLGVNTGKLADAAVTNAKIAANAVTSAKIQDASIANADIVDPWVGITAADGLYSTSTTMNLGQLITMQVNVDSSTVEILNDTLQVMNLGIGNAQLANGAVSSGKLATASVSTSALIDSVVTFQKLSSEVEDSILNYSPSNIGSQISDSLLNYFPVNTANILDETVKSSDIDPNYLHGLQRIDDDYWGVYPDDATIKVDGTNNTVELMAGYNVAADTTALKSYSKHDLTDGDQVYIPGLNSSSNPTGGGGIFIYKSSGSADHILSYAASGGGIWQRIDTTFIRPEWAGAVMDGTTDDYTAISNCINLAFTKKIPVILGSGTYKLNASLDITNPASSSGDSRYGIKIIGQIGANLTSKFLFASGASPSIILDGSSIAGARVYNNQIENLIVESAASKADTGIYINAATSGFLKDVEVASYKLGYILSDSDDYIFQQCNGGGTYGIHIKSNANGNQFVECAFTGNDSVGVRLSSCNGNVFVGGDRGNQPVSFECVTTATVTVYGGNFESHDSAAFLIKTNSTVNLQGSRFLKGTGSGIIAELLNTTNMVMYNVSAAGHKNTKKSELLCL